LISLTNLSVNFNDPTRYEDKPIYKTKETRREEGKFMENCRINIKIG